MHQREYNTDDDQELQFLYRSNALNEILLQITALIAENPKNCVIDETGKYGQGAQLVVSVTGLKHLD